MFFRKTFWFLHLFILITPSQNSESFDYNWPLIIKCPMLFPSCFPHTIKHFSMSLETPFLAPTGLRGCKLTKLGLMQTDTSERKKSWARSQEGDFPSYHSSLSPCYHPDLIPTPNLRPHLHSLCCYCLRYRGGWSHLFAEGIACWVILKDIHGFLTVTQEPATSAAVDVLIFGQWHRRTLEFPCASDRNGRNWGQAANRGMHF